LPVGTDSLWWDEPTTILLNLWEIRHVELGTKIYNRCIIAGQRIVSVTHRSIRPRPGWGRSTVARTVVGPDGTEIEVPEELYGVLRDVVDTLSEGLAITIASDSTMLTTQEAADLLNISRPCGC
jgi:hypothetical protein